MKKINLFLMLVMFGFGMIAPQTAVADITVAPCESITAKAKVLIDGGNCGLNYNARIAIAPYAQVVAGDSYTFIGVSHPSLATAHTSIGVVVEALDMVTVPNTKAGRAAVFTVSAGQTHRVFVVNQSHDTINLNNASFTDTQTHLITTSDASQFGNIRVMGIGTHPNNHSSAASRPGDYRDGGNKVLRHDNVSQLAMWGVVYQSANGAGFALEFVGDMHDSAAVGTNVAAVRATGQQFLKTTNTGPGRGVN